VRATAGVKETVCICVYEEEAMHLDVKNRPKYLRGGDQNAKKAEPFKKIVRSK